MTPSAEHPTSLDVCAARRRPAAFSSSPIEHRYGTPPRPCVSTPRVALRRQASTWTTPIVKDANARH